jgi:hypothetical protein
MVEGVGGKTRRNQIWLVVSGCGHASRMSAVQAKLDRWRSTATPGEQGEVVEIGRRPAKWS